MIEIRSDREGAHYFLIKNKAGKTVFRSKDHADEKEVKRSIKVLSSINDSPAIIERHTNSAGDFLFKIRDVRGKAIGKSRSYNSEAGMENGIVNLKSHLL